MIQEVLVEVALITDAVDRLERPLLGHVPHEPEERLTLCEVTEPAPRLGIVGY